MARAASHRCEFRGTGFNSRPGALVRPLHRAPSAARLAYSGCAESNPLAWSRDAGLVTELPTTSHRGSPYTRPARFIWTSYRDYCERREATIWLGNAEPIQWSGATRCPGRTNHSRGGPWTAWWSRSGSESCGRTPRRQRLPTIVSRIHFLREHSVPSKAV